MTESEKWKIGIFVTLCGIAISLFIPEVRCFLGIEKNCSEKKEIVNPPPLKKEENSVNTENNSFHPSPEEIQAEIEKVPLYLESEVRSSYVGMNVKWDVTLHSIEKRTDKGYSISTVFKGKDRSRNVLVFFGVNIENYPFFKTAKRDQPFLITGKITSVGKSYFTVDVENIYEK